MSVWRRHQGFESLTLRKYIYLLLVEDFKKHITLPLFWKCFWFNNLARDNTLVKSYPHL